MPRPALPTLAGAALACALAVPSPAPLAAQAPERLLYYVDREDSYRSLVRHIDRIDVLGPQVYTMDSLGIVFGSLDPRVKALAKRHGVKLMPLVVNEGFQQPGLRRFLADSAARQRATSTLAELCRREGYWGWQLDIENVNLQDRERFTEWYREVAEALHGVGCTLSLAVVHRLSDEAGPTSYHRYLHQSWRDGHDLKALAEIGDFITIMSYDQHTRRTPPGPTAGVPWMRAVAEYALRHIPPEKLSLGIPLYGNHWFTRYDGSPDRIQTTSQSVGWFWGSGIAERNGAELRWDAEQGVTWAVFENGGTFEWLFLEDVRAFRAKYSIVTEKKLRGFSAWVLGREDERIWEVLGARRR
jgi:spore germination protein YaaH